MEREKKINKLHAAYRMMYKFPNLRQPLQKAV